MNARDRLVVALVAGSLAAGTAFSVSELALQKHEEAARERQTVAFLPTGFGAKYDRAVARMIRINHLLERRQTELFYAKQRRPLRADIAHLRRQVVALEREYKDAIAAMARVAGCEACAEEKR